MDSLDVGAWRIFMLELFLRRRRKVGCVVGKTFEGEFCKGVGGCSAMNNSPITPTPVARSSVMRLPVRIFDIWEAVKHQEAGLRPSLTSTQVQHCRDVMKQLKLKWESNAGWRGIDEEFYTLSADKFQYQQALSRTNCARHIANQSKNRYINVLPFDDTRVVLDSSTQSKVSCDYINASYIVNLDCQVEELPTYIATQGPLESTVVDFWEMVMQQKCPVIVMLTRLVDGSEDKCAHYFPAQAQESQLYEHLQVTTKLVTQRQHYVQRILEIQDVNTGSLLHTVMHLEYLDWPDFGVPQSTALVRDLIRSLQWIPAGSGPFVVHCSAGIGRTGTFCTIDHTLRRVLAGDITAVDIQKTLRNFRSQRGGMIQTRDQYRFCYEAVMNELEEVLAAQKG